MIKLKSFLAALSLALLLAASDAQAAFTYSVTANPVVQPFGQASLYTVVPAFPPPFTSQVLAGTQNINLVQTFQASLRTNGTDTTVIPVSIVTTINNVGDGSGSFVLRGNINVTRSDVLGAASTFTMTSIMPTSLTLGQFVYTLSTPTYTAPTILSGPNANGGISVLVTEHFIPEPASMVMMGTSVLALGGLTVLRRRRQS